MSTGCDILVIGGGHNGLVAAARLAKAGRRVLVVEARPTLGGAASTEEIFPGCRVDNGGNNLALLNTRVCRELQLETHGLELLEASAAVFAPGPDDRTLTLWRNPERSIDELSRRNPADAARYPEFVDEVARMAGILNGISTLTPPDLHLRRRRDLVDWGRAALGLKRLGRGDMMEFLRVLPMPVKDYLDERFEDTLLKGLMAATGVAGLPFGPRAGGTTLMWLYQNCGGFLSWRQARGGTGALASALAAAATAQGAEIRTESRVARIELSLNGRYRAVGVEMEDGERLSADIVVSNADPRRTLFELIGPQFLDPSVMRAVRAIRYQGCIAKMDLTLEGLPGFLGQSSTEQLSGRIRICPDMDYLERASDEAKYGRPAQAPLLDIALPTVLDPSLAPPDTHLMSVTMQYAPYRLRTGDWDEARKPLEESLLGLLEVYAPGLRGQVRASRLLSPLDLERDFDLTGGCIHHGRMGLDGVLMQRPFPGWSRYRTPIENLYLCGAGTHPGGGVTGVPGYNAAREILAAS